MRTRPRKSAHEGEDSKQPLAALALPANVVLHREIEPLLTRPVGRPSKKPVVWYHDFFYQAGTWDRPRRVVAKIEHHQGKLFPRVGFIVTNLRRPSWQVVKFYNGRGTAEQWIKEGHGRSYQRAALRPGNVLAIEQGRGFREGQEFRDRR